MKTFKDLVFKDHGIPGGKHARMDFENGYGVSVITGVYDYSYFQFDPIFEFANMIKKHSSNHIFYTDDENPYEVAIFFGDKLIYTTPITDDVVGHCNEERVTEIMKQVQELKS